MTRVQSRDGRAGSIRVQKELDKSNYSDRRRAGYVLRRYQDPTLPNINGLSVDASLTWLASALTTALRQ